MLRDQGSTNGGKTRYHDDICDNLSAFPVFSTWLVFVYSLFPLPLTDAKNSDFRTELGCSWQRSCSGDTYEDSTTANTTSTPAPSSGLQYTSPFAKAPLVLLCDVLLGGRENEVVADEKAFCLKQIFYASQYTPSVLFNKMDNHPGRACGAAVAKTMR